MVSLGAGARSATTTWLSVPVSRSIGPAAGSGGDTRATFRYGGNVDGAHRQAVIERLRARGGPGDLAAAHTARRLPGPPEPANGVIG
jgi:hypothetical protein